MEDHARTFEQFRTRLQGIAYRMLGSVAEAEDVVQDAWLRWHEAVRSDIVNIEAWLVSVTTRLSIDRLRAAKTQREHYQGMWLPEPVLSIPPATPEEALARADDVSLAYLTLLEKLGPEARAAFLLREVFDTDYAQISQILGKSQSACRQLVSRARSQLREEQPRFSVDPETHHRLLHKFVQTLSSGDLRAISALLAEEATLISDGGGLVASFPKPLLGAQRIAQLFYATHRRFGGDLHMEIAHLNGRWALLRFTHGQLESAMELESDGKRIAHLYVQRNPDKLRHIAQVYSHA
ncbi:RNA polymerase sigma-70 factor [Pusillimonas noertemannii]|uniref:RNA polymerase sigma-70 factor n=1 Tax=Pusillimonas noertemannii TaxID=305977 RepID=UPI00333FE84B